MTNGTYVLIFLRRIKYHNLWSASHFRTAFSRARRRNVFIGPFAMYNTVVPRMVVVIPWHSTDLFKGSTIGMPKHTVSL